MFGRIRGDENELDGSMAYSLCVLVLFPEFEHPIPDVVWQRPSSLLYVDLLVDEEESGHAFARAVRKHELRPAGAELLDLVRLRVPP